MRDVLGTSDHVKGFGQATGIERRVLTAIGAVGGRAQALTHDHVRGSPLQDALAAGIVGLVEAVQQGFQIAVAGDCNAQHLPLDTPVEALDHAIGFGRIRPRFAVLHPKLLARRLKAVSREARAAVGKHMGDLEGEGPDRLLQEGHGAALGLIILHRQVDEAGGTIDGDIQVPLAALAILGAQFGQVLHVYMDEAKIVVLEGPIWLPGAACGRQTAQALGFQDAVDRVSIEMPQKVANHKGEVIQRKARRTTQSADNGALLFGGFPRQLVGAAGVGPDSRPDRAYATCGSSRSRRYSAAPGHRLAPVIAQSRPGQPGWCEPWGGSSASGPPRPSGLGTPVKAPGIRLNRPTNLVPTTFRRQTPSTTAGFVCCPAAAEAWRCRAGAKPRTGLRSWRRLPGGLPRGSGVRSRADAPWLIFRACWPPWSGRTAGTSPRRPATTRQTACRSSSRAFTGTPMRSAMICGPMWSSTWVMTTRSWCWMRRAFSRRAPSRPASTASTPARRGASRTARSACSLATPAAMVGRGSTARSTCLKPGPRIARAAETLAFRTRWRSPPSPRSRARCWSARSWPTCRMPGWRATAFTGQTPPCAARSRRRVRATC